MCFEGGEAMLRWPKVKIDCYARDVHVALGKGARIRVWMVLLVMKKSSSRY